MKRSGPIKRKTPLKAGKPLSTKKRIRKSNPEKKRRSRADPRSGRRHTYGGYHQWIKRQPCEARGDGKCDLPDYQRARGLVDGHHVKSIASGGRDYGNEIPLCRRHHIWIETYGPTKFTKKTGVDPAAAAERWRKEWDRTHPVHPSSTDPGRS